MRRMIMEANQGLRQSLSNDLGAITGLLFDVGNGRIIVDGNARPVIDNVEKRRERLIEKRHMDVQAEIEEENTHTRIQYILLKIGKSLNCDVVTAANDRMRSYQNEQFSFFCLQELPKMEMPEEVLKTVSLIDVMWLKKGTNKVVCAFEIEKSTSIYSGILRLTDLACTFPAESRRDLMLCLVAPDEREKDIIAQLKRPAFRSNQAEISYILFSDLCDHCNSICKLGDDHSIMKKIVKLCPA